MTARRLCSPIHQQLGFLPTNYWVSYQLPTNYWVSYQPTSGYLTNQLLIGYLTHQLQSNNKQTNKGFFERWLKWSGITYQKGSNGQLKRVLKSKTWPDLSSLMRGCTRQPRKGQDLLSISPPPWQSMFKYNIPLINFPPPWQSMLLMNQVQV